MGIPKSSGIYQIRHSSSGRSYVGSSVNLRVRIREHKSLLRTNSHWNKHLQSAWNKYGADDFEFLVIELCDIAQLHDRETFLISEINALHPSGFNMCPVAGTIRGLKHPPEFGAAIRARKSGQKMHPNSQAALIAYHRGRKHTPELKAKRSKALREAWAKGERGIKPWQERQMRIMYAFGKSSTAIAKTIGVSISTICCHIPGMIQNRRDVLAVIKKCNEGRNEQR